MSQFLLLLLSLNFKYEYIGFHYIVINFSFKKKIFWLFKCFQSHIDCHLHSLKLETFQKKIWINFWLGEYMLFGFEILTLHFSTLGHEPLQDICTRDMCLFSRQAASRALLTIVTWIMTSNQPMKSHTLFVFSNFGF